MVKMKKGQGPILSGPHANVGDCDRPLPRLYRLDLVLQLVGPEAQTLQVGREFADEFEVHLELGPQLAVGP
jgi:hypothetical protein